MVEMVEESTFLSAIEDTEVDIEYGRILVMKRDGSTGGYMPITSDLSFGRDVSCEVLIKLPSVSRFHARILVDDGKCILVPQSTTNPTQLNGKIIANNYVLRDGDVIDIRERRFVFKSATSDLSSQMLSNNSHLKEVQIVQVEDENQTINVPRVKEHIGIDSKLFKVEPTKNTPSKPDSTRKRPVNEGLNRAIVARLALIQSNKNHSLTPIKIKIEKTRPTMKTPLRQAIQMRRKSHGENVTATLASQLSLPTIDNEQHLAIIQTTTCAVQKPVKEEVRKVQKESRVNLFDAIRARRRSHLALPSPVVSDINIQSFKSETDIAAASTPLAAIIPTESHISSPIIATSAISNKKKIGLGTAIKKAIHSRRLSVTKDPIVLPEKKVEAVAIQAVVDSMATEIALQGVVDSVEAYDLAVDKFLCDPKAFEETAVATTAAPTLTETLTEIETETVPATSTSTVTVTSTLTPSDKSKRYRSRGSLLYSIEKKGTASHLDTDPETVSSEDIVESLTEEEMKVINVYADQIESLGTESVEAFAIAFDSYVRGIEKIYDTNTLTMTTTTAATATSPMDTTDNTAVYPTCEVKPASYISHQICEIFDEDSDVCLRRASLSGSLSKMFRLPKEFLTATDSDWDMEMVEIYAEDLQANAYIDSAVAHGIALDTYLADPIGFRIRVGGLELPPNVTLPATSTTVPQNKMRTPNGPDIHGNQIVYERNTENEKADVDVEEEEGDGYDDDAMDIEQHTISMDLFDRMENSDRDCDSSIISNDCHDTDVMSGDMVPSILESYEAAPEATSSASVIDMPQSESDVAGVIVTETSDPTPLLVVQEEPIQMAVSDTVVVVLSEEASERLESVEDQVNGDLSSISGEVVDVNILAPPAVTESVQEVIEEVIESTPVAMEEEDVQETSVAPVIEEAVEPPKSAHKSGRKSKAPASSKKTAALAPKPEVEEETVQETVTVAVESSVSSAAAPLTVTESVEEIIEVVTKIIETSSPIVMEEVETSSVVQESSITPVIEEAVEPPKSARKSGRKSKAPASSKKTITALKPEVVEPVESIAIDMESSSLSAVIEEEVVVPVETPSLETVTLIESVFTIEVAEMVKETNEIVVPEEAVEPPKSTRKSGRKSKAPASSKKTAALAPKPEVEEETVQEAVTVAVESSVSSAAAEEELVDVVIVAPPTTVESVEEIIEVVTKIIETSSPIVMEEEETSSVVQESSITPVIEEAVEPPKSARKSGRKSKAPASSKKTAILAPKPEVEEETVQETVTESSLDSVPAENETIPVTAKIEVPKSTSKAGRKPKVLKFKKSIESELKIEVSSVSELDSNPLVNETQTSAPIVEESSVPFEEEVVAAKSSRGGSRKSKSTVSSKKTAAIESSVDVNNVAVDDVILPVETVIAIKPVVSHAVEEEAIELTAETVASKPNGKAGRKGKAPTAPSSKKTDTTAQNPVSVPIVVIAVEQSVASTNDVVSEVLPKSGRKGARKTKVQELLDDDVVGVKENSLSVLPPVVTETPVPAVAVVLEEVSIVQPVSERNARKGGRKAKAAAGDSDVTEMPIESASAAEEAPAAALGVKRSAEEVHDVQSVTQTKKSRSRQAVSTEPAAASVSTPVVVVVVAEEPKKGRGKRTAAAVASIAEEVIIEANKTGSKKSRKVQEIVVEEEDEEEEDEICLAILCDSCDGEFILEDVGLSAAPEGDWFCPGCSAKKGGKRGGAASKQTTVLDKSSSGSGRQQLKKSDKKPLEVVETAAASAATRKSSRK
eukprot:gene8673-17905_t